MNQNRFVYIISDLHIGGEYGKNGDRGFRICNKVYLLVEFINRLAEKGETSSVELVINGDFVDFLAEESGKQSNGTSSWEPFIYNPEVAVTRLQKIADREKDFGSDLFGALAGFLAKGNKLTILLGNHDIELSFPRVRQKLKELLEAQSNQNLTFIYDGEAYSFGEVIIEHGNQYDIWNQIDYDALRRVRSLQSRGRNVSEKDFEPIPGSNFVAHAMNPAKKDFPFVDLLKPETWAAIPILLSLKPSYAKELATLAKLRISAEKRELLHKAYTGQSLEIANIPDKFIEDSQKQGSTDVYLSLEEILRTSFSSEIDADKFLGEINYTDQNNLTLQNNSGHIKNSADIGVLDIPDKFLSKVKNTVTNVIDVAQSKLNSLEFSLLCKVLEPLEHDKSFDISFETDRTYKKKAQELASLGKFKYVIFGHTHLAKREKLCDKNNHLDSCACKDQNHSDNCTCPIYFNTGTWADLIKLPKEVFDKNKKIKEDTLRTFIKNLEQGNLDGWITCEPHYVKLELDNDNKVVNASLCQYNSEDSI